MYPAKLDITTDDVHYLDLDILIKNDKFLVFTIKETNLIFPS